MRTAITIGEDARGTTAYFGDQRGYAYALDADAVIGEVDGGWAPLSRALNDAPLISARTKQRI